MFNRILKRKWIIISVVILFTLLLLTLIYKQPVILSEKYSDVINNVDYIEVRDGSSGEQLVFETKEDIDTIIEAVNKINVKYDINQNDRAGWRYDIKIISKDSEKWLELIIGGSRLYDNNSISSGYYKVYGHEGLVEILDSYFDENLESSIESLELQLEEVTSKYQSLATEKDLLSEDLIQAKNNYEALLEESIESEHHNRYSDINVEDKTIRIYSEGTDYLEDGIICNLELLDNNERIIWHLSWDGIQVTELPTHSQPTVSDNRIYIVIDGELKAIDFETGELIWCSDNVGSSSEAPVVDNDGCIYLVGQYSPFLSAITAEGDVKWQIDSDDMYGTYKVTISEDYLLVNRNDEVIKFDKDGNKIE